MTSREEGKKSLVSAVRDVPLENLLLTDALLKIPRV